MKSELVLSHGKQKKPRITSDYDLVVAAMERREALNAMRKDGIATSTMTDEELADALQAYIAAQAAKSNETDAESAVPALV